MKEAATLSGDAWNDLNAIEGIGEIVARAIVEFYKEPRNVEVITAAARRGDARRRPSSR